jgi:hypothetical protein
MGKQPDPQTRDVADHDHHPERGLTVSWALARRALLAQKTIPAGHPVTAGVGLTRERDVGTLTETVKIRSESPTSSAGQ